MIKNNFYDKRDEKFGKIKSIFYSAFASFSSSKKFYYFVINDINNRNFNSIMDIGCGTGFIINSISKNKHKTFYGIDPSAPMLDIAKKDSHNVKYMLGSSRKIGVNKKFDIIFTSLSFHHWPDKISSLLYLKRFLNENGRIIIYEYNKDCMNKLTKFFIGAHAIGKTEINALIKAGIKINVSIKDSFVILEIK